MTEKRRVPGNNFRVFSLPNRRLVYFRCSGKIQINKICAFVVVMLLAFDNISSIRPFERGFFCDDQELMYPLKENTVGSGVIIVLALFATPAIMFFVELTYFCFVRGRCSCTNNCVVGLISSLYKIVGMYLIGGSMVILLVELCKTFVGRLRPHFFEVCQPNWTDLNCTREFVTDYNCTNADKDALIDARKSFPSGHAAAACYEAFYLVVYLHVRVQHKTQWARVLCPVIQTLSVGGAIYISISRLQDYRHHPTDVAGGAVIGIVGSIVTILFHSDLPKRFLLDRENKDSCIKSVKTDSIKNYDNKGLILEISKDMNGDKPSSYDNKGFVIDMDGEKQISNMQGNIQITNNDIKGQNEGQDPGLEIHKSTDSVKQKTEEMKGTPTSSAMFTPCVEDGSENTRKRHVEGIQTIETPNITKISIISSEKL